MKRKNPSTSIEAFHSLNPFRLCQTHINITKALEVLGKGNFESIAAHMGVAESIVWRRINECVKVGYIHNTGETIKTKSGRKSFLFAAGKGSEEVEKKKKGMKGPPV